jgi:hypothetical protein
MGLGKVSGKLLSRWRLLKCDNNQLKENVKLKFTYVNI